MSSKVCGAHCPQALDQRLTSRCSIVFSINEIGRVKPPRYVKEVITMVDEWNASIDAPTFLVNTNCEARGGIEPHNARDASRRRAENWCSFEFIRGCSGIRNNSFVGSCRPWSRQDPTHGFAPKIVPYIPPMSKSSHGMEAGRASMKPPKDSPI